MAQSDSVELPPRLPLLVTASNRNSNTNKDARLVNCYLEFDAGGELYVYRRPGLGSLDVIALGQVGRGVYYWRGDVYSIFGSSLYRNNTQVGTGLDTTNGVYRFDSILGAVPKLILGNGKKTYTYNTVGGLSADLHTIDANYPAEVVKGFAYLNGPIYVQTKNADIWGSKVNSVSVPGDWDPLNFIAAQIEPDGGVATNKQLVYVIAFNEWSTEVFFDAGNPVASPLGPVQGSKANYGCVSADSVQRVDDVLFWLCTNQTASKQVAMMNQLAVQVISTPAIDRLLEGVSVTDTIFSWQLKIDGHSFYIITFKQANLTLAYDIVFQQWFQWTDADGNYFPIVSATYDVAGRRVLQHESNGRLYYASTEYYTDLNDPIVVDIYTPIFDAGTVRRKQLNMMRLVGDQVDNSVIEVRYSDNDYQTWSQPRLIDMGTRRPALSNCGTFIRRAYNFRHAKDTFFRLQAVDVQIDIGTL